MLVVSGTKTWTLLPPSAGEGLGEGMLLEAALEELEEHVASTAGADRVHGGAEGPKPGGGGSSAVSRAAVSTRNASLSFFTAPADIQRPDHARHVHRRPHVVARRQQLQRVAQVQLAQEPE